MGGKEKTLLTLTDPSCERAMRCAAGPSVPVGRTEGCGDRRLLGSGVLVFAEVELGEV